MMQRRFGSHRTLGKSLADVVSAAPGLFAVTALAPCAYAEQSPYLVNMTVHPGCTFPNCATAVYGYPTCDKMPRGRSHIRAVHHMRVMKADVTNSTNASPRISYRRRSTSAARAIWQPRNSNDRHRSG
jgi:hypothetical protein